MISLVFALAMAASTPSPEAERLGREIAGKGTLGAMLPLIRAKEIDELVKQHGDLSAADQAKLRATAERVFADGAERLQRAIGHRYAMSLSLGDLRTIAAFYRTPAARHFAEKTPQMIAEGFQAMGKVDFKADATAAYCRETGKLCAAK